MNIEQISEHPVVSVYRRAAQLIKRGEESFCCTAIVKASKEHGVPSVEYTRQFELMFGPKHRHYKKTEATVYNFNDPTQKHHPFWCKVPFSVFPAVEKRQKKILSKERELALLMMAAICENPA